MGREPLPVGERGNIRRTVQPDGSWVASCRYRDVDGVVRQVRAVGASGQKAENALKKKLGRRASGGDLSSEHRVAVLAEEWFATVDKSPGTRDTYRRVLDCHIIPGVGALLIREATTARLDGFIRAKAIPQDGRGGPTAARQCRTVLMLMFGLAARYDAVPANPVRDTATPARKRPVITAMTLEQFQQFHRHLSAWAAVKGKGPARNADVLDVVEVFIATGLRPGELLGLRFEDVDFAQGTLAVTGTVKRTSVEGLHRQAYPKSESGGRVLRLPVFALAVLHRRWLAQNTGLVFTNRLGGVWEPSNFSRVWRAARGEEWAWIKPSSFRKAVATLIERESGSLMASRQLGHSSDAVTIKHYIEANRMAPDSTLALERFRAGA